MDKPIIINIPSVEQWTLKDLKYACKRNKVKNYTKMNRVELIAEVNRIINKIGDN